MLPRLLFGAISQHITSHHITSPYLNQDMLATAQVDEKAVQTPFDGSGRVQISFPAKSCPSRFSTSAQHPERMSTTPGIALWKTPYHCLWHPHEAF